MRPCFKTVNQKSIVKYYNHDADVDIIKIQVIYII